MSTGYHAAASAEVKPGDTAVVMGDGAVGLCGVIAAKMRGATRIIAMSRHEDRAALAVNLVRLISCPSAAKKLLTRC